MTTERGRGDPDTAARILDVAERLAQVRGFNGFSYADIADELGITKAALHYHFAGKADLGEALIGRYADRFDEALAALDAAAPTAADKLRGYTEPVPRRAPQPADVPVRHAGSRVPDPARPDAGLGGQLLRQERGHGCCSVLEQGRADGSLTFTGSTRDTARMIISCLEGAMLVARPYGDTPRFQDTAASLLGSLTPATAERD